MAKKILGNPNDCLLTSKDYKKFFPFPDKANKGKKSLIKTEPPKGRLLKPTRRKGKLLKTDATEGNLLTDSKAAKRPRKS